MLILGLSLAMASNPVMTPGHPGDAIVQLEGELYGARMDTPLRIRHAAGGGDAASVLDANARAMADVASWVELSAGAVALDDYGRFRLVVAAVDGLPMRVVDARSERVRSVSEALNTGVWTREERLLAVMGGLRALGVAATAFQDGEGTLFAAVSSSDVGLNVSSVDQHWRVTSGGYTRDVKIKWILWNGRDPLGSVSHAGGLRSVDGTRSGRAMRLADARLPAFTLNRALSSPVRLRGGSGTVDMIRHPDAAGWLSLTPELHLPGALPAARRHVRRSGLLAAARQSIAGHASEEARINSLIRLVQGSFVYEPGPVRTIPELLERGKGDCDQLSLVLAALLLELGYRDDEVVVVNWPTHLGLALRPRGSMPADAVKIDLDSGSYVLIDTTHYIWKGGRLTSRWGRTAPEFGTRVTVERLRGG